MEFQRDLTEICGISRGGALFGIFRGLVKWGNIYTFSENL